FFSSRRRHTSFSRDWSSDVCSSDLHVKGNPMAGTPGGIIDKTMPIHISNVALYNPATGKGDRVGIQVVDGKKVRIFRSNGAVVRSEERRVGKEDRAGRAPYAVIEDS